MGNCTSDSIETTRNWSNVCHALLVGIILPGPFTRVPSINKCSACVEQIARRLRIFQHFISPQFAFAMRRFVDGAQKRITTLQDSAKCPENNHYG